MADDTDPTDAGGPPATRRRALLLGGVSAATVVTIRPALAQTGVSVSMCEIPIPPVAIAQDGKVVPTGTAGAVQGGVTLKADDVRKALNGGMLPGTSYDQSNAYTQYIRRLQQGQSGFTCFASLQMPRR